MELAAVSRTKSATTIVSDKDELKKKIPKLAERLTQELVIALVGPIGSGCTMSAKILSQILTTDYEYQADYYKLSDYIAEGGKLIAEDENKSNDPEKRTIIQKQDMGDKLRKIYGNNYLAAKAIEKIAQKREAEGFGKTADGNFSPKSIRRVHIIDSIKHPDEMKLLKDTYGGIFWLVGVFAPHMMREKRLQILKLNQADLARIIERDYTEDEDHGQKVKDVFYQADFFVRNDKQNDLELRATLNRFVDVIFGHPVHTPTLDESSMYAAYAEAAKSACLSRQVGAAIVSSDGELIGLGRNDVPKFGGGLYSEDNNSDDHRCHAWQSKLCHNDRKKDELYTQIYTYLIKENLINPTISKTEIIKAIKNTDVRSLIEYSRAVHAEMDAIISVARTNKPGLLRGTLYSTTFPCHSCARHIVAGGISKVIFIEPYPKSLATELHSDAVSENESDLNKMVVFLQYSGIAPKNILKLFNTGLTRKDHNGRLINFDKKSASPVVVVSLDDYSTHEQMVVAELKDSEEVRSQRQPALPLG